MIILNINELLKFATESVTNYFSALVLLAFVGFVGAGIVVSLIEKTAHAVAAAVVVIRNNGKIPENKD